MSSRHGVRSPTGEPELFGAYDRMQLSRQGLLKPVGCEDAAHVTVYTDSDQRTRETGKALAAGLFPGCALAVQALAEGVHDPLFHALPAGVGQPDSALAVAALSGRIGGNPNNLTEAYRSQIAAFDQLLASCGASASQPTRRTSLLEIPAKLAPGKNDRPAELRGPLNTAVTLTENLLLEYAEGVDGSNVGWGCVDGSKLRSLIELHTAASDFVQRTKAIARMQASNLLDHVRRAMEQSVTGKPVSGARAAPGDRALFLIGHDTNLTNLAGMLNLTWIIDGRRDDIPPAAGSSSNSGVSGARETIRCGPTLQRKLWSRCARPQASPRTIPRSA
jgi:4-phytase/acid phosphatase